MVFNAELKDVDLETIRFIYEDSLPVNIQKGSISMSSRNDIKVGSIDSRNRITLNNASFSAKPGENIAVGFMPIGTVCDALNQINPIDLKFDITGDIEKPQFGGFQESLLGLIKPYLANVQERIKSEGMRAISKFLSKQTGGKDTSGSDPAGAGKDKDIESAVNSIKSLFGDKGQ